MTFSKLFFILILIIAATIGAFVMMKPKKDSHSTQQRQESIEVPPVPPLELDLSQAQPEEEASLPAEEAPETAQENETPVQAPPEAPTKPVPTADRINEFFNKTGPRFPIVETITYKSRVEWQKGRPAWLSDYAAHYQTSRHFIARSLNGKPDYFKQDITEGAKFNVLRPEKNINFYLLVDLSRHMMWFYYLDNDSNQRTLVKTYNVGLGSPSNNKKSGLLTPLGKYTLGSKVAIYKPSMMGHHNGQKVEMMTVYGTRWIPFEQEISNTTAPAKGLGIFGTPWKKNEAGELVEDTSTIGKYEGDGGIRLASNDIEELFSIIITKPTTIELVKDFYDAELPGKE